MSNVKKYSYVGELSSYMKKTLLKCLYWNVLHFIFSEVSEYYPPKLG